MHELETTQDILRFVIWEAKKHHAKKVLRVLIKIGPISSMIPEYIQYYFKQISQNTIAEGAKMEIRKVPLVQQCGKCGFLHMGESFRPRCQQCESRQMRVLSGTDIIVDSVEFE
ncbi:MAG: hydrogenase maturation nickel metallochaperone HypA [Clostridia bacterium]|jgi:hydrogenase nickel incorporation protein HypA/HybF